MSHDVHITVNTATTLNTMRGGIGASWHAIELPMMHRQDADPIFVSKNDGGSGWGGYPPAEDHADVGQAKVFKGPAEIDRRDTGAEHGLRHAAVLDAGQDAVPRQVFSHGGGGSARPI